LRRSTFNSREIIEGEPFAKGTSSQKQGTFGPFRSKRYLFSFFSVHVRLYRFATVFRMTRVFAEHAHGALHLPAVCENRRPIKTALPVSCASVPKKQAENGADSRLVAGRAKIDAFLPVFAKGFTNSREITKGALFSKRTSLKKQGTS
jgi:hypothetical protein